MSISRTNNVNISSGNAACGAATACGAAPQAALPPPRVVTTGRKKHQHPEGMGLDLETGEPVEISATRKGILVTRYLVPTEDQHPASAIVDALSFSVTPPDDLSYMWVLEEMAQFLDVGSIKMRRGMYGFRFSARLGDGVGAIAWGGDSQNGRVFMSLMGQGCSRVRDWPGLALWLEKNRAAIKRADLAHDDLDGHLFNIDWAVNQYKNEGFNAGGRKPHAECMGDWLDGEESTSGRTLGIGRRQSGKYCRIYEKGKQLGDPTSRWTRIEVEWRAQDRFIPYDILTQPGRYLAGAYPCLALLSEVQCIVKTIAKGAQIVFDRAVENAKLSCGKLVNLMLKVVGGDYAEVVNRLIRPGVPARIEPFSYHIKQDPFMLDSLSRWSPCPSPS